MKMLIQLQNYDKKKSLKQREVGRVEKAAKKTLTKIKIYTK